MSTKQEAAMRQALEALEYVLKPTADFDEAVCQKLHDTAITGLREALAEQAAESDRSGCAAGSDEECTNRHCATKCPALAEQQAAEPVEWPHKWGCRANAFGECNMGCTVQQPTQQPLTDGQIGAAIKDWMGLADPEDEPSVVEIARAIEAAHGITSKKGGAA